MQLCVQSGKDEWEDNEKLNKYNYHVIIWKKVVDLKKFSFCNNCLEEFVSIFRQWKLKKLFSDK
jgi:hypothetical protein